MQPICPSCSTVLRTGLRIRIDLLLDPDPYPDPDPAFFLTADPDPGLDDLKFKKFTLGNIVFIFLIKNCNLLIPRPP